MTPLGIIFNVQKSAFTFFCAAILRWNSEARLGGLYCESLFFLFTQLSQKAFIIILMSFHSQNTASSGDVLDICLPWYFFYCNCILGTVGVTKTDGFSEKFQTAFDPPFPLIFGLYRDVLGCTGYWKHLGLCGDVNWSVWLNFVKWNYKALLYGRLIRPFIVIMWGSSNKSNDKGDDPGEDSWPCYHLCVGA